jgi:hypothetical protein
VSVFVFWVFFLEGVLMNIKLIYHLNSTVKFNILDRFAKEKLVFKEIRKKFKCSLKGNLNNPGNQL